MEILDKKYNDIMQCLDYILTMCGLEKGFINKKLDNGELLQSELDSALMELMEIISEKDIETKMQFLDSCIDFDMLKKEFDEKTLFDIDKVIAHFVLYQLDNDNGEKDIISEYTSKFGNEYIIDWFEGIINTNEFIKILKEGYIISEV